MEELSFTLGVKSGGSERVGMMMDDEAAEERE